MAQTKSMNKNAEIFLKILTIACAIILILIGFFGFFTNIFEANDFDAFLSAFLSVVVSFYLLLFGLLILLAELSMWKVIKYFGFLMSYGGRGAFLIYTGLLTLPLRSPLDTGDVNLALIAGIVQLVVGCINLMIACCFREGKGVKPSYVQG
jgi:hypothetical protein